MRETIKNKAKSEFMVERKVKYNRPEKKGSLINSKNTTSKTPEVRCQICVQLAHQFHTNLIDTI